MHTRCNRVESREFRVTRESSQASLILAQVCQSCDCFAGNAQSPLSALEDLCIFPIKATCNSNELEDINLRAVNPKKPQKDRRSRRGREVERNRQKQAKATKNQRDAKEADKKKGKCQAN